MVWRGRSARVLPLAAPSLVLHPPHPDCWLLDAPGATFASFISPTRPIGARPDRTALCRAATIFLCQKPALSTRWRRRCLRSIPAATTLRQRIVLRMIIWAGSWVIRLLGPTLRVCISYEEGAQRTREERPLVESFWHSCMIPATYICRDMGVRVMSSNSYDGEYMGRIIRKFGFVAVKGSSSRNAVRALLGLRRALTEGWTVAFTLDGPRGPRHKVKPGPVALARSTGIPMSMFHVAVDRAWVLNSWDRMMIPKPFSRVLLRFGKLHPRTPRCDRRRRRELHCRASGCTGSSVRIRRSPRESGRDEGISLLQAGLTPEKRTGRRVERFAPVADAPYSRVEPSSWYRYFLPSQ